jgi:hypothetical protein
MQKTQLANSSKQQNVALTMGNRDKIVANSFENGKTVEQIKTEENPTEIWQQSKIERIQEKQKHIT